MFEATLQECSILRRLIESIKDLVNDVNLETSSDGIALQAMDSSHVALVSLTLHAAGFVNYRSDKSLTLGINIANFCKVMRLAASNDSITLKAKENENKMIIVFENAKQGKKTEFAMNLLTLDSEVLGIPDKEYQVKITTNASEFTKLCKELYQVAETVNIEAEDDNVIFTVEGDMGNGRVEMSDTLGEKTEDKTCIEVKEPVKLSFALRYLIMFNKASTCAGVVSLMLSAETPLVAEYAIGKLGMLRYYLAPKISEEAS
eukprot:TRINITY_DN8012_c0_g1_i11.p2 TRINITY_DN8012_c0_g1~~TRINITY_DN8012_c0_g1_i11.p2  ORF type:complete len:260 (-),score=96.08 TRINITY_DN8012_c0_g1_i11:114-893(-)